MVESSMDSCKFSQQKPLERDKDYHMVMQHSWKELDFSF